MKSMRESNLVMPEGFTPTQGTWLSVDVVALTEDEPQARVVLINRKGTPHQGTTTLPGGLLDAANGETVEGAAIRVLREKAGIAPTSPIAVVDVVSDPERDERGHTVSIVVVVRVPADSPGAVSVDQVPHDMPFSHYALFRTALRRMDERLLSDPDTTYALLGSQTATPRVSALLNACITITGPAARARLDRSPLYRRTQQRLPVAVGRPPLVYVQT